MLVVEEIMSKSGQLGVRRLGIAPQAKMLWHGIKATPSQGMAA